MSSSSFRPVASLLFENVGDLAPGAFLHWDSAKSAIKALADDPQLTQEDLRIQLGLLQDMSSWGEFFLALAGHRLFSEPPTVNGVLSTWAEISGFDVDGLLDIGDQEALEGRLEEDVTARFALGKRFLNSTSECASRITENGPPKDEHVHFGQIVDLGLVWLQHLKEEQCYWRNYRPHLTEDSMFHHNQEVRSVVPGPGFNLADKNLPMLSRQIGTWATCMSRARLVFAYFLENGQEILSDRDNENAIEFISRVAGPNVGSQNIAGEETDTLSDIENERSGLLSKIGHLGFADIIRRERSLVSHVNDVRNPLAQAFAAIYMCMKSAAMHRVCANSVHSFESFTRALKVLQYIYDRRKGIFDSEDGFVSISKRLMLVAGAVPENILYRVSHSNLRLGGRRQLRPITSHWKTAKAISNRDHAKIVLSFHREDFFESPNMFDEMEKTVLSKYEEWEETLECKVIGVDLCGPEVRDVLPSVSESSKPTSSQYLFDPIDRVFDFRSKLSNETGRQIFASFHLGEHAVDWETGLLASLALLTDIRFVPETDRISHALILAMPRERWPDMAEMTQTERDAAVGRILRNCKADQNALFLMDELELITQKIDEHCTGDGDALLELQDLVQRKVTERAVIIELCPYSNMMIRNVSAQSHPWKNVYEKGNFLVGTDDPSLTQTFSWLERAALSSQNTVR